MDDGLTMTQLRTLCCMRDCGTVLARRPGLQWLLLDGEDRVCWKAQERTVAALVQAGMVREVGPAPRMPHGGMELTEKGAALAAEHATMEWEGHC